MFTNRIITGLAIALAAAPAAAVPGGELGTMPTGYYYCELPGNGVGAPGRHQPADDFSIVSASSYTSNGVRGTYLLTGDNLVMTSGPHRGNRYQRVSRAFLRKLDADGQPGGLRCIRARRNNS